MSDAIKADIGLIHLYTGDGKGKTSAAVGLAVRARGARMRVGFYQFMKASPSGEVAMLESLGATTSWAGGDGKFAFQMTDKEKSDCAGAQCALFKSVLEKADQFDVLIMDELCSAIDTGMIPERLVIDFLDNKPVGLEVVITGRDPSGELLRRAGYISEIRCVRHPYQKGIGARKGIEF